MVESLESWVLKIIPEGVEAGQAAIIVYVAKIIVIILLAVIVNYVAKKVLLKALDVYVKRSKTDWDDIILRHKVFTFLAQLAPALVIYTLAPLFPESQGIIRVLAVVYMVLIGVRTFTSFLNAINDIYLKYEISRERPITPYIQVIKIITYVMVSVFVIGTLMNKSPWALITGLGAVSAIILLIFRDSILGFVAGMQLTFNDMVRRGDWIEMPKYGADGDVIDVTLNTVKVQNWDKTVTMIPTYALVSDSFKNWRGMQDSGGRRIKRAINIDMNSVKFCTEEMIERFSKIQYITEYIREKEEELAEYNEVNKFDTSMLVNGRHMTNIGTFRAYIEAYLHHHPKIRQDMTFLIRHLRPTEHGIPIEIYVFSNDIVWAHYESIQADIFDHILAVIPEFDLRVFQRPSGRDLYRLVPEEQS